MQIARRDDKLPEGSKWKHCVHVQLPEGVKLSGAQVALFAKCFRRLGVFARYNFECSIVRERTGRELWLLTNYSLRTWMVEVLQKALVKVGISESADYEVDGDLLTMTPACVVSHRSASAEVERVNEEK